MHFGTFVPLAMARLRQQPTIHRFVSFQFIRLIEFCVRARVLFFSIWFQPEKHSCHDRFISIYNDPLRQQVIDARALARARAHTRFLHNVHWKICDVHVWIADICGKLCMNFSFGFFSLHFSKRRTSGCIASSSRTHVIDHKHNTHTHISLNWFEMMVKMRDSNLFCYLMICDRGVQRCAHRAALDRTFNWFPSHQVQCTHLSESIELQRIPFVICNCIAATVMLFILWNVTNRNELLADLIVVARKLFRSRIAQDSIIFYHLICDMWWWLTTFQFT